MVSKSVEYVKYDKSGEGYGGVLMGDDVVLYFVSVN